MSLCRVKEPGLCFCPKERCEDEVLVFPGLSCEGVVRLASLTPSLRVTKGIVKVECILRPYISLGFVAHMTDFLLVSRSVDSSSNSVVCIAASTPLLRVTRALINEAHIVRFSIIFTAHVRSAPFIGYSFPRHALQQYHAVIPCSP